MIGHSFVQTAEIDQHVAQILMRGREALGGRQSTAVACLRQVLAAEILPKGAFFLRPGVIGLVAGDPMPTAGLTARDRNRFTEALQEQVVRLRDRAMWRQLTCVNRPERQAGRGHRATAARRMNQA